jgi:ectoine hydroxylase-related dioxygenase (phytanoyl-CoA dioxygenase family)
MMRALRGRSRGRRVEAPVADGAFTLSEQQVQFFETFGFLRLPALFAPEIDTIRDGFDEVFAAQEAQVLSPENEYHRARDAQFDDETRLIIPAFIDKSAKLRWLRDDARVVGIARALLGESYVYAESDGNIMNCDVWWHVDAYGAFAEHDHIKLFFYLDPLRHEGGALRFVPGTHLTDGTYAKKLRKLLTLEPATVSQRLGVAVEDIPSWTLEVDPGDVIVGDFRTLHASFNGSVGRRLFTVNFGSRRTADPSPA